MGDAAYAEQVAVCYTGAWRVLAEAAGMELAE